MKNFRPEIPPDRARLAKGGKLFLLVVFIAVVISVVGILLLRNSITTPMSDQATTEATEEHELGETALKGPKLIVSMKGLKRGDDFYVEGIESLGEAMPFRSYHTLAITRLDTNEQKEIALGDLVDEQTFSYVKELEDDRTPPSLYLQVDESSFAVEGKTIWGRIDLFTSADPPFPFIGNYFKIGAEDWNIETFAAPTYAANAAIHPKREMVLYDTLDDGLFLHLLDLRTGREEIIVSYPIELIEKYVDRSLAPHGGYPHFGGFGEFTNSRALQPQWIDENTISYLDFETREKVVVDLDVFDNWQTYRNDEFGFEVKHPKAWYADDSGTYVIDYFQPESKFMVTLIHGRASDHEGSTVPITIGVLDKPTNLMFEEWLNNKFATEPMQKGSIEDAYNKQHTVYNEYTRDGMEIYEVGTFEKQTLTYHTLFHPEGSQYIYFATLWLFAYGNGGGWEPSDSYFIDAYDQILGTFRFVE